MLQGDQTRFEMPDRLVERATASHDAAGSKSTSVWMIVLLVAALIGVVMCGVAVVCAGTALLLSMRARDQADARAFVASATLTVGEDGCTVMRSEVEADEPVIGLQWVVRDEAGNQVLGRNAEGEYQYRYFRPGVYTLVLEAFDGRKYVEISNSVAIGCP